MPPAQPMAYDSTVASLLVAQQSKAAPRRQQAKRAQAPRGAGPRPTARQVSTQVRVFLHYLPQGHSHSAINLKRHFRARCRQAATGGGCRTQVPPEIRSCNRLGPTKTLTSDCGQSAGDTASASHHKSLSDPALQGYTLGDQTESGRRRDGKKTRLVACSCAGATNQPGD